MRVSLVDEPPATLAVLSWINSDLSSASWVARSSLDLFQSWAVFCGGCKYADERGGRELRGAGGCTYDLGLRLQAAR